jgi:hypothetical protein
MSPKLILAMLPMLALAACKAPEPEPQAAAVDPPPVVEEALPPARDADAAGKAEWDFASVPVADTSLRIEPDPVDFCSGSQQAVTVHWEVPANSYSPEIWVQAGPEPKLFAAPSTPSGSEPTGAWVGESSTFFMVDGATGKVLQQLRANAAPCG